MKLIEVISERKTVFYINLSSIKYLSRDKDSVFFKIAFKDGTAIQLNQLEFYRVIKEIKGYL